MRGSDIRGLVSFDIERALNMDEDLLTMSKEELVAELQKLRAAIREHRDSTGHNLCWYHPELYALLPEPPAQKPTVPEWPEFMKGCVLYRQSLDEEAPHLCRTREQPPE